MAGRAGASCFWTRWSWSFPWSGLLALVRPHYAKAGNGRRPVGLEMMLRTYFVQQWFNLSDPGVEEALYESPVLQRLVGVSQSDKDVAFIRANGVSGVFSVKNLPQVANQPQEPKN